MTAASFMGIAVFFIGVPVVTGALYAMPHLRRIMLTLMIFSICHIEKPFYMEVFFEPYRGVDRGFGVTVPDLFFFGFFFWLVMGGSGKKLVMLPSGAVLWLMVIFVSTVSLVNCPTAYYGFFTLHKFVRALILLWVMVNLVRDKEDVEAVINGLMASIIFQGAEVFFQKYVTKSVVNRSIGSFPHPNSLAMYVDLIIPTLLALILSGGFSKKRNRLAIAAVFAGMLCVVFTKSRAALVIMIAALGSVTAISVLMKPTSRKIWIIFIGFIMVDMIAVAVAPKVIKRFQTAPKASEMTREYFNDAAIAMANDHLFGTGINSYSWMLGNTQYYWYVYPNRVDTVDDPEAFRESKRGMSRLGTAHHIYLLYAAETGWIGMCLFILFLLRLYVKNIILLLKTDDEYFQAVFLGLLIGFSTLHLQGLLEWIFRQTQVFYLFFALAGLMTAMGNIMKEEEYGLKRVLDH